MKALRAGVKIRSRSSPAKASMNLRRVRRGVTNKPFGRQSVDIAVKRYVRGSICCNPRRELLKRSDSKS